MLKNAYFLGKYCKHHLNVGGLRPRTPVYLRRLGAPPSDPRVVTPAYYYNFVEFVSSVKCILFRSKKTSNYRKYSAFASSALLHLFFNSNSVIFVEGGRKNISCPRAHGTLATPLLTAEFILQSIELID